MAEQPQPQAQAQAQAKAKKAHNVQLVTSSILHWFLLAGFITVFFWYRSHDPKIPAATSVPAASQSSFQGIGSTYTENEQKGAEEVGHLLQSRCLPDPSMVNYLTQLKTFTDGDTDQRNSQKRKITIGIVIGLGVLVIIGMLVGTCEYGIRPGAWGRIWGYSLIMFVIFCAFELFFFIEVIKKYWPMGTVAQACIFVKSLDTQIQSLLQGTPIQAPPGHGPVPALPPHGVAMIRNYMLHANDPKNVEAMIAMLSRHGLPL